jgi:hypothetical protein
MGKRFRYETPRLIDLREDMYCSGVSCSNGTYGACALGMDITESECGPGSCYSSSVCGTGTKAESCCSGNTACSTWNFATCQAGTSVYAEGGTNYTCACSVGSMAGMQCYSGTVALGWGCGCGGNNGGFG